MLYKVIVINLQIIKMPYRSRTVARRMRGRGIKEFFGKVNQFLKKHRVISRVGSALGGMLPGKYGAIAGTVGSAAGKLGYGRRRRRYGGGLRLSGM